MTWIKNNWIIVIGVLVLGYFLFNQFFARETTSESKLAEIPVELQTEDAELQVENNEDGNELKATVVFVDVKGEVLHPGVYEVDSEKRVSDVIAMAGGFTDDANVLTVNLAQKVMDEMIIYIGKQGEEEEIAINMPSLDPTSSSNKVRINMATKEEILTLKGIGEVKADAIINHREIFGKFSKVEELLEVNGIGEKTLDSIRDFIQIP